MDTIAPTLRCSRCNQHLPPEAFAPSTRKQGAWCSECMKNYLWLRNPPKHGPPRPKRVIILPIDCPHCGITFMPTTANSTACRFEDCKRARWREDARRTRATPTPQLIERRRAEGRKRRALRRGAEHERYRTNDIADRDGWRCQLCRKPIDRRLKVPHPLALTIDHILPLIEGGADTPANVQAAHLTCNCRKNRGVAGNGEQLRLVG